MDKKVQDIVDFIEKMYGFKLFDYQIEMVKAIVEGKTFSIPRQCGRTMIINGYKQYLNKLYENHMRAEDADINIKPKPSRGLKSKINAFDEYHIY